MSTAGPSLDSLIGQEAIGALIRRGLLVIDPFPQFTNPTGRNTSGFDDAIQGARIGIRLSRAARRLERRRPGSANALLANIALTASGALSQHEIQLDLSAPIWSCCTSQAPERVASALRSLPDAERGSGRAIKHLRRVPASTPWFDSGLNSFGYAGIMRTVGVAGLGHEAPAIAMADMAITHAHPTATWTAATLAALISLCVESSPTELSSKIDELLRGLDGSPIAPITSTLGNSTEAPLADLARRSYLGPTCESLLPIMFAAACTGEDPAAALRDLAASGAPTPVVAVAGAVLAARHGVTRFPKGWTDPTVKVTSTVSADLSADHIWMLLDRSGSMKAIREAMEHGIDQFIDEQRTGSTTPTGVTIIQFDDQNPHEIVVDAPAISGVPSLKGRLHPRGMTPLYDAIGHLLDRAEQDPRTGEQKLVVIITDGLENASRSVTQATIFDRIAKLEDKGWTFVFLGANQDSYATGGAMRIADGNISNFTGSREGVERAYAGLSRATTEWRGKEAHLRYNDRREFWGGVREAEEI